MEDFQKLREEEERREKSYMENAARMGAIRKHFRFFRFTQAVLNIAVFLLSFVITYRWYLDVGTIAKSDSYADYWSWSDASRDVKSIDSVLFPASAVNLFLTPIIIIASIVCENLQNKKACIIALAVYSVIALFGVSNFIFCYEPMTLADILWLIFYGVSGLVIQYKTFGMLEENERLSHLEGYPDFYYLIDMRNHSHYVKAREQWLEKQKKQEYYTKDEKPLAEYEVTAPEKEGSMDSIRADMPDISEWFEGKEGIEHKAALSDELSDIKGSLENDDDYIIEDIRRKPL